MGVQVKRIFAVISEQEFYECIAKGRRENLDLGEVLAILVHLYVDTGMKIGGYKDFAQEVREKDRPPYMRLKDVDHE